MGLAGLPARWRRAIRDRLLNLQVRLAAAFDSSPVASSPQLDVGDPRVQLLQSQLAELQDRIRRVDAARDAFDAPEVIPIPARAYPLAAGADLTQRLMIDRGRQDGIARGQAVLVDAGGQGGHLIGRVVEAASSSAEVQLLTDPTFLVRAEVLRGDPEPLEGLLVGDGEGLAFEPAVHDEAAPLRLPSPGEPVVCSRASALCPIPALIGTVLRLERRPGDPYPHAVIAPAADLARIDHVFVLAPAAAKEAP